VREARDYRQNADVDVVVGALQRRALAIVDAWAAVASAARGLSVAPCVRGA